MLINDYGFYNVPFGATHCTGTWLDIVLIDSIDKLLTSEKSKVPFICNHDYLIIDCKLEPFIFNKISVCTRDFRKFHSDLFTRQLKLQIDSSSFSAYISKDPNLMLEQFQMIALGLLDEQAPFINRTIKKIPAPWFNTSLRLRCKERDKLYNKAKRMASAPLMYKYKLMRKQLKCDIRLARDSFFLNKLQDADDI